MADLWTFLSENELKVLKGLLRLTARTYNATRAQANYVLKN
jgi:hypothetical protein